MLKHWWQMAEADMEVVLKSIHDPSCAYLHQHLTTEGVNVTEPATEVPEGWTFLRQLPKKVWKTEVWELIVMCFDHLSEVHAHMSSFVTNMSSLAKIANPETFDMVMKVAAQLMIQINVPGVLPESESKIHLQRQLQKNDCPGWRKSYSPECHLLHGNHSTDPPGF